MNEDHIAILKRILKAMDREVIVSGKHRRTEGQKLYMDIKAIVEPKSFDQAHGLREQDDTKESQ